MAISEAARKLAKEVWRLAISSGPLFERQALAEEEAQRALDAAKREVLSRACSCACHEDLDAAYDNGYTAGKDKGLRKGAAEAYERADGAADRVLRSLRLRGVGTIGAEELREAIRVLAAPKHACQPQNYPDCCEPGEGPDDTIYAPKQAEQPDQSIDPRTGHRNCRCGECEDAYWAAHPRDEEK